MTIVQRMKAKLPESMKARDAVQTQFLRYWMAQLTKSDGTEVSDDDAIKKMRGILKEAKTGRTTFTEEELNLIRQWIPPALEPDEIVALLAAVADQIKGAPKEGMAMGIAMKTLAGRPVDSDDVKAAVAALRG